MSLKKIIGTILLVVGISLAVYGFNLQNTFEHKFASTFGLKDDVLTYIIAGAVASIAGIILLANKGHK